MSESTEITMFVCANCARPGTRLTSADRVRPTVPDFKLPARVQQIIVPCTGRLQPEHILRAFESGSSIVSIIACQEDNCHHAEGSRRCALRVGYLQTVLREIGLGGGRLLLSYLPGSASQDLSISTGKTVSPLLADSVDFQIAGIRARIIDAFETYPRSPLQQSFAATSPEDFVDEDLALNGGDGDE